MKTNDDRITLLVCRESGSSDWLLMVGGKKYAYYADQKAAIGTALSMDRNNPGRYAICVDDAAEPEPSDYYGHRRDQVVFSAAVVLGSLILGFVLGCIAAGMKAGVFKW